MAKRIEIGSMDRVPPQNIEAERSVLGGMLLDSEACVVGLEILKPEYFYSGAHSMMLEAMRAMQLNGSAIDLVTVTNYLRDKNNLERVGGPGYLAGLVNVVPTVEHTEHYASIVKDKAFLRAAIKQAERLLDAAYRSETTDDVLDIASRLPSIPDELETFLGTNGADTGSAAESLYERHRMIAERGFSGVKTGWLRIDDCLLEGIPIGYPMILSGIPGTGKTAFLIRLLDQISERHRVLFYSLEMPRARVWSRRCASMLYINRMTDPGFNESQIANTHKVIEAHPQWKQHIENEKNWHIDERTRLSFPQIIRGIRRFKREHPDLMVVAIDHLGRVRLKSRTNQNQRERELAIVAMTDLAKELEIVIIWVIQPDTKYIRDPGNRPPSVASLDYFTKAAQEAGAMFALVRKEDSDEVTVYITKGRHGGTGGKVKMRFRTNVQTFEESL